MDEEAPPREPPNLRLLKRKRGQPLTADLYESLLQAYLALPKRSARALSRATGISHETALRAVNVGWPSRQWASLRERAQIYDAKMAKAKEAAELPLTAGQLIDVQRFITMREDNLNAAGAMRAIASRLLRKVMDAAETATATRQGKRTRVIDVLKKGRVVGQRTVQEDVTLPPYLPHLAQAAGDIGRLVFTAGQSERDWSRVVPPEGAPDKDAGWERLSNEQLAEVVSTGKLPAGVTHEMVYGGRARPK